MKIKVPRIQLYETSTYVADLYGKREKKHTWLKRQEQNKHITQIQRETQTTKTRTKQEEREHKTLKQRYTD